jgi:glucose-1-phosphate adenylyltransferase
MPGSKRRLYDKTYVVVLAGGRGSRLHELTDWRAKPAVPFGGNLNIIDFALSNCVNSDLRHIGVLTQYKAQSLIRHIVHGWGFLSDSLGEYLDVVPAQQQQGKFWYSGTADAVYQNLHILDEAHPELVLILGGDHIYKMDYSVMLAEHQANCADLTVACLEVPLQKATEFGVMSIDDCGRVLAFDEKPTRPQPVPGSTTSALASMGIYLFDANLLTDELVRDAADTGSSHDFGKDIIPSLLSRHRVFAHPFANSCVNMVDGRPYWRDVGTVDAYWEANMDLVSAAPELNLYDDDWPIFSHQRQLAPVKFVLDDSGRGGVAINSLMASGCIVSGATVHGSVFSSKVRVAQGSVIEDSVILPNVRIGQNVHLCRAVVDKHCVLPDGYCAGKDPNHDRARGLHVTPRGVTLIVPEMLGQAIHRVN